MTISNQDHVKNEVTNYSLSIKEQQHGLKKKGTYHDLKLRVIYEWPRYNMYVVKSNFRKEKEKREYY